jgi:hypothetical protein
MEIQTWSIGKLVLYSRNPRKNDAAWTACAAVFVNSVQNSVPGPK